MNIQKKRFDDIKIGDSSSFDYVINEDVLIKFAEISGDYNPLHVDSEYAQGTEFKGRIVHGMFLGALVSRLVGMDLPGKSALLVKETLEFKNPAYVGDVVKVIGTVVHKSEATKLLEIEINLLTKKKLLVSGTIYVRVLS